MNTFLLCSASHQRVNPPSPEIAQSEKRFYYEWCCLFERISIFFFYSQMADDCWKSNKTCHRRHKRVCRVSCLQLCLCHLWVCYTLALINQAGTEIYKTPDEQSCVHFNEEPCCMGTWTGGGIQTVCQRNSIHYFRKFLNASYVLEPTFLSCSTCDVFSIHSLLFMVRYYRTFLFHDFLLIFLHFFTLLHLSGKPEPLTYFWLIGVHYYWTPYS